MTAGNEKSCSGAEKLTASTEPSGCAPAADASPTVFARYSDAELDRLLSDIRRLDEDDFVGIAHSAAVKD